MKIRKVDDKPMVIHTKEKAKIHAHEPKGAKIKGMPCTRTLSVRSQVMRLAQEKVRP